MKILREAGLQCLFCGGKKVRIRKNASKKFQVECTSCGAHTGWYTKPQSIIQWYNIGIQYWKSKGYLSFPDTTKKA